MLADASVGTEWIAQSRSVLDAQAAKLAASLYAASGAQGLAALKNSYATHTSNISKAKNGLGAIKATLKDAVAAAEVVSAARFQIGSALRLDSENMLRETDNDPSRRLSSASDAIIVGSTNWSGVTGKLKDWFDHSDLWESGALAGKVGAGGARVKLENVNGSIRIRN